MEPPLQQRRIGVFGGSFDPPHHGHLITARAAAEYLKLDTVLMIPAAQQPRKLSGPVLPAERRLRLVQTAIKFDRLFQACDIEIGRGGTSFTVDTLTRLRDDYPPPLNELFLLIGADSALEFTEWKSPEHILELANVAVLARTGSPAPTHTFASAMQFVPTPTIDISSTDIRRRIAEGRSISHLLPRSVELVIKRGKLYSLAS